MATKYRPCPFCGHKRPSGGWIGLMVNFVIMCRRASCEARIIAETEEDAISRWNRRPEQPNQKQA